MSNSTGHVLFIRVVSLPLRFRFPFLLKLNVSFIQVPKFSRAAGRDSGGASLPAPRFVRRQHLRAKLRLVRQEAVTKFPFLR